MAASKPQIVDPVASYARRHHDSVTVVMQLPGAAPGHGASRVRLVSEHGTTHTAATATEVGGGVRVEAEILARRLPTGVWELAVQLGDTSFRPLEARLLTSRTQPIALITGPAGRPSITPAPQPGPRRRAAAKVGRVIDRALAPLPPARAKRVRRALRKAARTVLG